jgi:hypothetical protein
VQSLDIHRSDLAHTFDPVTLRRAGGYVVSGRVLSSEIEPMPWGAIVSGRVLGTAPGPYDVEAALNRTPRGWSIDTACTCPMSVDCKHAAALLLSVRGEPMDASPRWERQLDGVLTGLEKLHSAGAERVPLALLVDLTAPHFRAGSIPVLSIRPMRRGAREAWIKTGAAWSDVQYAFNYRREHDPAQVAALTDLAASLIRGYSNQNPNILTAGPVIWPLLRRALEAGVVLVPGRGLASIALAGPLSVEADLSTTATGDLLVRAGVGWDDTWWPDGEHQLLFTGEPAHGVALLRSLPVSGQRRVPLAELTLAPLERPVAASVRDLVESPLVVPADQHARFGSTYLPRLRRQLPLGSRDGSALIPEPEPPHLELLVAWGDEHRIETSWSWRYAGERFALDSREGFARVREPEVEQRILAALDLGEDSLLDDSGRLLARIAWTDHDLVRFATETLPRLRDAADADRIDLRETGQQRGYRPATSDPEISFSMAD